jgi:hypothetical protein
MRIECILKKIPSLGTTPGKTLIDPQQVTALVKGKWDQRGNMVFKSVAV